MKKSTLHLDPQAVKCIVRIDKDIFARGLADAEHDLKGKKDALVEELMRRALSQNPELASALKKVEEQQERVKDMRRAEEISIYREWQAKRDAERIANRKIRYDDRRNYNKLNAIRRDSYYKSLTRLEQIQREIRNYWEPYNLPLPQELIDERNTLLQQVSRQAG